MNVAALQKIDRLLGIPFCFFLTVLRWLVLKDKAAGHGIRSILLVKLGEQGSTVLACDAIQRAVSLVGKQNVYFVVFEENRFILDAMDVVPAQNVFTISTRSAWGMGRTALNVVRKLRRLKLDSAVDMEFFSRGSAALAFLSGAKLRAGFHAFFGGGPYRGNLMTHRLQYNPYLHTGTVFCMLVEALLERSANLPSLPQLGGHPIFDLPLYRPSQVELESVRRHLPPGVRSASNLVILNPNAGDLLPLRRWPAERYVELAKRLLKAHPDATVVFTGSATEAATVSSLADRVASDRCVSVAGQTSIRELLALYSLGRVLVTNDSGPAHFAALTAIKVVALFGPETPQLFAPPNSRTTALWASLPCSPCVNAYNNRRTPCRNNLCMQALSVEQVFKAASATLESDSNLEPTQKRIHAPTREHEVAP